MSSHLDQKSMCLDSLKHPSIHLSRESKTKLLNSKLNYLSKTNNFSISWFNASNFKPVSYKKTQKITKLSLEIIKVQDISL